MEPLSNNLNCMFCFFLILHLTKAVFLSISMGTICTWQKEKALWWRRAVREVACRQAAGDVSASWMPPHALRPWIYGCATVIPGPLPAQGSGGTVVPCTAGQLVLLSPATHQLKERATHRHAGIQWIFKHTHCSNMPGQITRKDARMQDDCVGILMQVGEEI